MGGYFVEIFHSLVLHFIRTDVAILHLVACRLPPPNVVSSILDRRTFTDSFLHRSCLTMRSSRPFSIALVELWQNELQKVQSVSACSVLQICLQTCKVVAVQVVQRIIHAIFRAGLRFDFRRHTQFVPGFCKQITKCGGGA